MGVIFLEIVSIIILLIVFIRSLTFRYEADVTKKSNCDKVEQIKFLSRRNIKDMQ